MTDEKERRVNPRSLENLKLGAEARYQGKIRRNTTLLPETIEWLQVRGNVSEMIDQLVAAASSGSLLKASDMVDQVAASISELLPAPSRSVESRNTHDSTHQQTEPSGSSNDTHDSTIGVIRWNVYERVKGEDRDRLVGSHETEAEADRQIEIRKDHNHRKNSMDDYGIVSLLWDKRQELILPVGYAVPCITREKDADDEQQVLALKDERDQLLRRLDDMTAHSTACEQQLRESQQIPDMEAVRDRILATLKLGKQAPEYKRTKMALDKFIAELRSPGS